RIGDLIWAAADQRVRGFLLGGTAGRTTLMGEGLQHQDGHSHLLAATVPNLVTYDPAFAYELAVIIREGIRRMYEAGESIFYYITLGNEPYQMPGMPEGSEEGILRGMYRLRSSSLKSNSKSTTTPHVHLLGSGSILRETLKAREILADRYQVASDVWSVTSYKELRREALDVERWNLLHPGQESRVSYVEKLLAKEQGPFIAASDYMKSLPEMITRWIPGGVYALGSDGFGRSDNRTSLRRFFEVDAECIVLAALTQLARRGQMKLERVQQAIKELGIDPEKMNPMNS
ncbi:MAG TPA: pyruvate dehydrogenase (acetyl-transferring), homodimeric type, partial [Gemmataceae bacterium]|nr:pyruvate dehydrogenase (acetyl-transferring), homodimeric type [Gemmataceae bacterium]